MSVAPRFELWAHNPNAKSSLTFLDFDTSRFAYRAFTAGSVVWREFDFVRHDDSMSVRLVEIGSGKIVQGEMDAKVDTSTNLETAFKAS
jgi:hypothetical protein